MSRTIFFFKNYFLDFYNKQPQQTRDKIDYVLLLVQEIDRVKEKFLKHLEGTEGLYEIRVKVGNEIFRIFCFFDKGNLVILLNGFQKKSQKTPKREIKRAEQLRKEYYEEKQKSNESE